MIEDIQNQRLPPAQGIEMKTSKRNGGLSDGYIGLMHYQRWKNSVLNATSSSTSSSQPLDGEVKSGRAGRQGYSFIVVGVGGKN